MVRRTQKTRPALGEVDIEDEFKRRLAKIRDLRTKGTRQRQEALKEVYAIHRKTVRGANKKIWNLFLKQRFKELPAVGPSIRPGSKFLQLLRLTMPGLKEYSRVAAALDYGQRQRMKTLTFKDELGKGGYIRLARLETLERTKERLIQLERTAHMEAKGTEAMRRRQ